MAELLPHAKLQLHHHVLSETTLILIPMHSFTPEHALYALHLGLRETFRSVLGILTPDHQALTSLVNRCETREVSLLALEPGQQGAVLIDVISMPSCQRALRPSLAGGIPVLSLACSNSIHLGAS